MRKISVSLMICLATLAPMVVRAMQPESISVRAAAENLRETVFGHVIEDPYRWMERPDRATDVEVFIRASSAQAIARLGAFPGRARLRERVAAGMAAGVRYSDLQQSAAGLFYRRTDANAQLAKLVMKGPDGIERVLYNPDAADAGGAAINSYKASPDGRLVALHTAAGGAEVGAIRFLDVATGHFLADKLEPVWGEFETEWLDASTVAYTRMTAEAGTDNALGNMRVYVHRLGGSDGPALLGTGIKDAPAFAPQEFPAAYLPHGSDWAIGLGLGARADMRVFVARRSDLAANRPAWRTISGYEDRVGNVDAHGDRLYLLTTSKAPNGEIRVLDLRRSTRLSDSRLLLPASDLVITAMVASDDGVYVMGQTDGIGRLLFLKQGSGRPVEIALPVQGTGSNLLPAAAGRGVTFALADWFSAPRWFHVLDGRLATLGLDSASYAGMAGARQIRETATSADGVQVPMAILLPPRAPAGPLPMLMEGYGSYGTNVVEPYYAQSVFGLLESGGAVAYCGTRGGGERGRAWHEAGRAANKPNAHADLIACGERLIAKGFATRESLTVMGVSAGGLLVPPVTLQRPDLFGALVADVALLNATRLAAMDNGPNQFAEMGDPNTAEGFAALLLSDAYQMLATARDMPDTLLLTGLNDNRVAPWQLAKFAALARDRFGDRHLVMLRTDPDAGHGVGTTREQRVESLADVYTFVLSHAGAEGFVRH
jgi:prolyl oligopeptidase